MAFTLRDLVDEKMARGGAGAFVHVSLRDFLTESGHRLDRASMMRIVRELAHADARRYLPVVAGALAGLAEDSDEFAGLVCMCGGARGGPAPEPLAGALADLGAARPDLAVRLARRLIRAGAAHPAAHLVGGAWRAEPAKCASIAYTLVRSADAQEAAAGIISMRVARVRHGIADVPAWIKSLSNVASRPDGAAAADAMDALVDMYPLARAEAGPMIEYLAGRHASCRSRLATRIGPHSSPFDVDTAKRYLTVCAGGDLDPQYADSIHIALAELAKRDCDAAVRIAAGRVLDGGFPGHSLRYALQEIGRAAPDALIKAILGRAGRAWTDARGPALASITDDIAEHAKPEAILAPLFGELDRDGPAARAALFMIGAMVSRNHRTTRDSALASRTLRHLCRYARAHGIDAERVAKKVQDADLKCASIVDCLLRPPPAVDRARVLENLEHFPAIKRALGPMLAAYAAAVEKGQPPHPLAARLSDLTAETFRRRSDGPPGGRLDLDFEMPDGPVALEGIVSPTPLPPPPPAPRGCEPGALRSLEFLAYFDGALALLENAGLKTAGYAKKMKNPDQFWDTIPEIAVVAALAGEHRVELEPAAGEKRLDAAAWIGPQRVLVEVLSPRASARLNLLEGAHKAAGNRVAGKILGKVERQLPAPDPRGDPIVLAVYPRGPEMAPSDAAGFVLGSGDEGECMHRIAPQSDSISAVVCFDLDMSAEPAAALEGSIAENPHAKVPLCSEARGAFAKILRGGIRGAGCG